MRTPKENDELARRLAEAMHRTSDQVHAPADAWTRFQTRTSRHERDTNTGRSPRWWVGLRRWRTPLIAAFVVAAATISIVAGATGAFTGSEHNVAAPQGAGVATSDNPDSKTAPTTSDESLDAPFLATWEGSIEPRGEIALLQGLVEIADGCVVIDDEHTGTTTLVLPANQVEPVSAPAVLGYRGETYAVGDQIAVIGEAQELISQTAADNCPTPTFLATSIQGDVTLWVVDTAVCNTSATVHAERGALMRFHGECLRLNEQVGAFTAPLQVEATNNQPPWGVNLSLSPKQADIFNQATSITIGKRLAIVAAGYVLSAAEVQEAINTSRTFITAKSANEADAIANALTNP